MADTWTDHNGRAWPVSQSKRRLKFRIPCHAAMRAFVFHRDGFKCCRCEARAIEATAGYEGRSTLFTDTLTGAGTRDMLVVDHVLTLAAGGKNHPDNMQTLCETCNRRKVREDIQATQRSLAHG